VVGRRDRGRSRRRSRASREVGSSPVEDHGVDEPGAEERLDDLAGDAADPGAPAAGAAGPGGGTDDARGPYDAADVTDDGVARVDLGGLRVPVMPGCEVRVDVQDDQVVAANVVHGDSALQLQAFAAPRSSGIWEEVRAEIVAGVSQSGGTADEQLGSFGVELRANVPVRRQDGRQALQPARFVGHDGPRWFLRGVLTGAALEDPQRAALLEQAFRAVVVVRGDEPKPPREPIPLRLPETGDEADTPSEQDGDTLDPLTRGPEITETR
jgi:hypothetical protein